MKNIRKNLSSILPKEYIDIPDFEVNALYIDIETTGFQRAFDMIYLIGLIYKDANNDWILEQYLCETKADEYELLYLLNHKLENYDLLVHFNGDRFDLPFIEARMHLYKITSSILKKPSFDYFPYIRVLKNVLNLEDAKLKSVEKVLGFKRSDPFTGGQLITLFKEYLKGDVQLEIPLILHNEEDMIGLLQLNKFLPMLSFYHYEHPNQLAFHILHLEKKAKKLSKNTCTFSPLDSFMPTYKDCVEDKIWKKTLTFSVKNSYAFSYEDNYTKVTSTFDSLNSSLFVTIEIPIHFGEYKYYFFDYKNYYYLPIEDMAIHQSIAEFVDRSHKKKATLQTSYQRSCDAFIALPVSFSHYKEHHEEFSFPLYYTSTKDTIGYMKFEDFYRLSIAM